MPIYLCIMVEINVYKVIDKEDVFMSWFGFEDTVFSADTIHNVFDEHPDEKEFKFNINCDGGSVSEGMRIYDILRTSGKTIYCNIENSCHSMAVCILLAAPAENRTANPNSRALIHEVRTFPFDDMTAEDLRTLADQLDIEQNAILDIYAERTGYDRAELEVLMKEEKQRTAQELLNYGFISKINSYNTNQKKREMSKEKKDVLNAANSFLTKLKNLISPEAVNYDFTDNDGNVLFSTEVEDDTLEVGMSATPDGTFELPDGRTVVIADGVITEINEAEGTDEETEILQNRISELENALEEAQTVITDLKNQVQSSYNAKNRATAQTKKPVAKTSTEKKNEAKEKLGKMRGGK